MKSKKVIINSAKEFCDVADRFVPSIPTLFQKEKDFYYEADEIELFLSVPATLKHHKLVIWSLIYFFFEMEKQRVSGKNIGSLEMWSYWERFIDLL